MVMITSVEIDTLLMISYQCHGVIFPVPRQVWQVQVAMLGTKEEVLMVLASRRDTHLMIGPGTFQTREQPTPEFGSVLGFPCKTT